MSASKEPLRSRCCCCLKRSKVARAHIVGDDKPCQPSRVVGRSRPRRRARQVQQRQCSTELQQRRPEATLDFVKRSPLAPLRNRQSPLKGALDSAALPVDTVVHGLLPVDVGFNNRISAASEPAFSTPDLKVIEIALFFPRRATEKRDTHPKAFAQAKKMFVAREAGNNEVMARWHTIALKT